LALVPHGAVAVRDLGVVVDDRAGRGRGGERGVVGAGDDDVEGFVRLEIRVADDGHGEGFREVARLKYELAARCDVIRSRGRASILRLPAYTHAPRASPPPYQPEWQMPDLIQKPKLNPSEPLSEESPRTERLLPTIFLASRRNPRFGRNWNVTPPVISGSVERK